MYQAIGRAPSHERGMKGLDEMKHSGFFWTESEKRDIKKVFILMGNEDNENIGKKPTRRRNLGRNLR